MPSGASGFAKTLWDEPVQEERLAPAFIPITIGRKYD
jgi:hypothetical protein